MPRNAKLHWRHWNPGLDNDHWTLAEVLSTLPGAGAAQIPFLIRLLENPASPLALPGAISLARHDAVHVLLGRGLSVQDEAFVIGFTMGATQRLREWQRRLFCWVSSRFYPKVYRFGADDLVVYTMAVNAARRMKVKDLQDFPFEQHMDMTLHALREQLGIEVGTLRAFYAKERVIHPASPASRRLDIDHAGVDPSDIRPPDGAESDWQREEGKP